jgi:hypothetical protein
MALLQSCSACKSERICNTQNHSTTLQRSQGEATAAYITCAEMHPLACLDHSFSACHCISLPRASKPLNVMECASVWSVSLGPSTVLLSRRRCFSTSGFGMIAPLTFATRTLVPSSKNCRFTAVGLPVSGHTSCALVTCIGSERVTVFSGSPSLASSTTCFCAVQRRNMQAQEIRYVNNSEHVASCLHHVLCQTQMMHVYIHAN